MSTRQRGFSLVVVLLLVSVLAGFLTGIVSSKQNQSIRREAEIAGWEAAKIARAARIFARDALAANPNLANTLSGNPQDIPMTSLMSMSMLPTNFARTNAAGEYLNAVGQRIRIILANYPIDGDPNDITTVPTAYIYFEDNAKSSGLIVQDIVQEARREGVAISAPVYNGAINLSGDCNGRGDAVIIWDTGCMGTEEFVLLTGEAYVEGNLVIPSWRSVNFDSRALMRFPQPENTGLPTMLTDIEMGNPNDCVADSTKYIKFLSDNTSDPEGFVERDTEICSYIDDVVVGPSLIDNRRDIINTANISSNIYIANPQSGGDVVSDIAGINTTRAVEAYELNISGAVSIDGDVKNYNGDVSIAGDLTADKNITVTNSNAGVTLSASVGTVNAGSSTSSQIEVDTELDVGGDISVQSDMAVVGSATIAESIVTEQLQMTGAAASKITVMDHADMLGSTSLNNIDISGAEAIGSYGYVTGELNIEQNVTISGDLITDNSVSFGSVTANRVEVTNGGSAQCLGDCPRRSLDEFCRNITGMTYNQCMAIF